MKPLSELTPREIDALVIANVHKVPCFDNTTEWAAAGRPYPHCVLGDGADYYFLFNSATTPGYPVVPSRDISAAWALKDAVYTRFCGPIQITQRNYETYVVSVGGLPDGSGGWKRAVATAKTFQRAICLAALSALGISTKEE